MRARLSCCTASQVSIASVCWSRIERTTALVLSVFSAAGGAGLEGGLGFAGACAAAAGVTTSPTATTKGRMLLSHSIGTSCLAFIRPGRSLRKRKSKASQSYPETASSSRTSPSRRTKRLASISEKISGGHSFRTLANGPSVPASTPSSARPAAHATGLPPNVLKNSIPFKVVAYITDTVAIRRSLDHLGLTLPEKAPPDVREVVRVPPDDERREIRPTQAEKPISNLDHQSHRKGGSVSVQGRQGSSMRRCGPNGPAELRPALSHGWCKGCRSPKGPQVSHR